MDHSTLINTVVLLSIIIPILIYAIIAFYRMDIDKSNLTKDFLYAGKTAKGKDYTNSSVAYMLQIYVTFYFIYWGYNYGFSNIFYMVGWGLGIYMFIRYVPRIIIKTMHFETLPSILSNNNKEIRVLFGLMSAIYFVGMIYLETHFATKFLNSAVIQENSEFEYPWWIFFIFLAVFVIIYSSWGGLKKVYVTDRYQLIMAYFSFSVVFSYLIYKALLLNTSDGLLLFLLSILIYGFLFYREIKTNFSLTSQLTLFLSCIVLVLPLVFGINELSFKSIKIPNPFTQVMEPGGLITLIGFTLINILWQFCDSSNYQRINSLSGEFEDEKSRYEIIKNNFKPIIFISPVTWGIGIILGMGIRAAGIDVSLGTEASDFISFLAQDYNVNHSIYALCSLAFLGIGISSIMLSTADSSIVALFQSTFRDVFNRDLTRRSIVLVSLILIVVIFTLAFTINQYEETFIYTIIASFNTQLLIVAPSVIFVLKGYFNRRVIFMSLIVGSVGVWYSTFTEIPDILNLSSTALTNVKLVYPVFVGLVGSIIPYIFYFSFNGGNK